MDNALVKQVLDLKATDRAQLVETILISLDQPDPRIDAIWADEAQRRSQALKDGTATTRPGDEVFKQFT